MSTAVSCRTVLRVLVVSAVVLAAAGVPATIAGSLGVDRPERLILMFHLDREANLPSWFSSFQLLVAAALLWSASHIAVGRFRRRWLLLSGIFLLMSIDESAQVHELFIGPLRKLFDLSGPFYFAWVLLGVPFVVILVVGYWKLYRALPWRIQLLTTASAGLYVGGALGMEMVDGAWASAYGSSNTVYAALTAVEEVLELCGMTLWLYTLLSYLQAARVGVVVESAAPFHNTDLAAAGLRQPDETTLSNLSAG